LLGPEKVQSLYFAVPLFWPHPLEFLLKPSLNLQGCKHIFTVSFLPSFFQILLDLILFMLNKKKERKLSTGKIFGTATYYRIDSSWDTSYALEPHANCC
jgi:hypothetical protein